MCERKAVWVIATDGGSGVRIYNVQESEWRPASSPGRGCTFASMHMAAMRAFRCRFPGAVILPAFLVTEPGETKVEVLTEPEDKCMWGVRSVSGDSPYPWCRPECGGLTKPHAMAWDVASGVVGYSPLSRYAVPLRVTESEPTTRIELHEAAQAILDHGKD